MLYKAYCNILWALPAYIKTSVSTTLVVKDHLLFLVAFPSLFSTSPYPKIHKMMPLFLSLENLISFRYWIHASPDLRDDFAPRSDYQAVSLPRQRSAYSKRRPINVLGDRSSWGYSLHVATEERNPGSLNSGQIGLWKINIHPTDKSSLRHESIEGVLGDWAAGSTLHKVP